MPPASAQPWEKDCIGDFADYHARTRPHAAAMRSRAASTVGPNVQTWAELAEKARVVATALLSLGVEPQDRICVLAKTRPEHCVINLAIAQAGAVSVPIYSGSVAESCRYIVEDAQASLAFADNAGEVAKLCRDGALLPGLRVIQLDGEVSPRDDGRVIAWRDLLGVSADSAALARRRTQIDSASVLSIVYTSGTTGRPKGVMVTHGNVLYVAQQLQSILKSTAQDVQLMFLPMAHVFAKLVEVGWLMEGHLLAFAEMQRFKEDLPEAHPTILGAVPRLLEKLYAGIHAKAAATPVVGFVLTAALRLSAKHSLSRQTGQALGLRDRVLYGLAKATVFPLLGSGLHRATGGALRMIVSGGAPLSSEVAGLITDLLGVDILEGYGLTESCGASCINLPGATRIGTVGPPLPRTQVKVAPSGELLIRGPGVMRGYWNNAGATAQAIDEGWLRTGDLASIDSHGVVRITGRQKDIIVTSGGKNIAPQNIEAALKAASSMIAEVVVYGDRQKYLTALVTIDRASLPEPLAGQETVAEDPQVNQLVQEIVREVNASLERYQTLKNVGVLDIVFSEQNGLLTPTQKVRRNEVYKRFSARFRALYGADWV